MSSSPLMTDDGKKTKSKLDYFPAWLAGFFTCMALVNASVESAPAFMTALFAGGAVTTGLISVMRAIESLHIGPHE